MKSFWIIAIVAIVVVLFGGLFFWYQYRRAGESFKDIDYSKLNNLDEDGWDDP